MSDFLKDRKPLLFFKWLFILIVFFTLTLSLYAVILSKNIESNTEHITIPLTNNFGSYRLDAEINDLSINFIFDTGASESILNQGLLYRLQELSFDNIDYLQKGNYILSDGSEVYCERIRIKKMKIGDHIINNVIFGIMPTETDNLLGKNVLDKYKRWSVNKNLNELTLVK